jgi:uncharacterized protein YvpB
MGLLPDCQLVDTILKMNRSKLASVFQFLILLLLCFTQVARADSIPDSASISSVTGHPQGYSLSCEARSAVDWMAFWGVEASEADFLSQLPRSDNPDRGFVGNPNDIWGSIPPSSYGVHAEPVADLIRQYGLQAEAQRDLTWDDLRGEIAAGRPVIVWIIGQMWSATPRSYTDADGHNTIVASFEHTMILTGYDETYVYVVDSFSGQSQVYGVQPFLKSWSVLGNMAVTGQSGGEGQEALPAAESQLDSKYTGATYAVQRGDFLIALAERFGISWQELAARNNVRYPYIIYPGQVLEVPGGEAPPEDTTPTEEPTPLPTLAPTLPPTPAPTVVLALLKPEDIRYRLHLPEVCLNCQPGNSAVVSKGIPRRSRGR